MHKVAVRRPYKTTQRDLISKSQNTVGWDRWDNMPATTTKAQVVWITCVAFAPELVLSWSTCLMLHLKFYFMLPLSKFNFRWLKVRTNRPELTLMNWLGARLAKSETVHRMKLTIFQHNDNILNIYNDKQNNLTASYKATDSKTSI